MTPARRPVDPGASVRARLLNFGRERGIEFQRVLAEFAIARLLYRLGSSPSADRFVLKGAMLFKLWAVDGRRATWDLDLIDLMGHGVNEVEEVVGKTRELCRIQCDDSIVFDLSSLCGEQIRAADEDAGVRVRLEANLEVAL
jgi:hypothetical protein